MAVHMNHSAVKMCIIEPDWTTALDIKHQALKPFTNLMDTSYNLPGSFCTFLNLIF